jgi:VanZ family protein
MKRVPFFLWFLVLISATLLPLGSIPEADAFGLDKLSHLFLFSVFVLFFFLGFGEKNWKFLSLIILFAMIDELSQYFIPGRVISVYDFAFNLSGVGLAYWVLS